MRALLHAAENPQRQVPAVIVAGTNGKGSTAATIASIAVQAGYRCGLYTSPHLMNLRERWIVGGRSVTHLELRNAVTELRSLSRSTAVKPTYFEALTILAFLLFRHLRCELSVLEVGMGGRLDATNVVRPLLSIITSVSFDHMEYLGNTLRVIAAEKAGVIHSGSIALTSSPENEVLEVIRRRCAEKSVPLHVLSNEVDTSSVATDLGGLRFHLTTPGDHYDLSSPLAGIHQVENVSLAVRAAEELRPRFPAITKEAVEQGVKRTSWRGRLEQFLIGGKLVVVDGGHNAGAAERIARFVSDHLPRPRLLVFGIMRDKQVREVMATLFPLFDEVIVTRPGSERAETPANLARMAATLGVKVQTASRPAAALEEALLRPGSVLVCGSLYLAGDAVRFLDKRIAETAPARKRRPDATQAAATASRLRPKRSSTRQLPGGTARPSRSRFAGKTASRSTKSGVRARASQPEK